MSKVGKGCPQRVKGTIDLSQDTIDAINDGAMPLGIELGAVQVGCTTNEDGVVTGAVFLCLEKPEAGGATTTVVKSVNFADGAITSPYTEAISVCSPAAPNTPIALETVCMEVDGVAMPVTPIIFIDPNTQTIASTIFVDDFGDQLVGTIVATDACNCPCPECGETIVTGCLSFAGFDNAAPGFWSAGDTSTWVVNGTNVVQDALSTYSAPNVGTGYQQIMDEVNNNVAGFTMAIVSDVASGKPTFSISYSGAGNETLSLTNGASGDVYVFTVDATGNMTATGQTSDGDDLTDNTFMGGSAVEFTAC